MIDMEEFIQANKPRWMTDPGRFCKGVKTSVFFGDTMKAVGICHGCPFQKPCLEWALANGERGVWGGTSERERKRIKRRMNP